MSHGAWLAGVDANLGTRGDKWIFDLLQSSSQLTGVASMYEDLVRLIEQTNVAFTKDGTGVTPASIARAEASLELPLPESYKWWLLKYGGGQIKGDVVYGLYEGIPDDVWTASIVALAEINKRNALYDSNRLVFCEGNGEHFFFDTTKLQNGEYPVFLDEVGESGVNPYAKNFAEFLCRRIRELYGIAAVHRF